MALLSGPSMYTECLLRQIILIPLEITLRQFFSAITLFPEAAPVPA